MSIIIISPGGGGSGGGGGGGGPSGAGVVPTPMTDIYVDSASGDDSNNGTMAQPVQTFDEAIERIPLVNPGPFNIRLLDAGPHDGSALEQRVFKCAGGAINIIGELSTTLFSGTATGGSTLDITDTGQAYTVDALVGKTVQYTPASAGDGQPRYRTIVENTTDTVTVTAAARIGLSTFAAASGDAYAVTEPGAQLDISGVTSIAGAVPESADLISGSYALRFINLDLLTPTAFIGARGALEVFGCEVGSGLGISTIRRAGETAGSGFTPSSRLVSLDLGESNDDSRFGQGFTNMGGTLLFGTSAFSGFVVAGRVTAGSGGVLRIIGGRLVGTGIPFPGVDLTGTGQVLFGGVAQAKILLRETGANMMTPAGVRVGDGVFFQPGTATDIDVQTAGSDGLLVKSGGVAKSGISGGANGTIVGPRYGAKVETGGALYLLNDGTGFSGTTADFAVGNTPDTAAAGGAPFTAAGGALLPTGGAPADGSIIQREL